MRVLSVTTLGAMTALALCLGTTDAKAYSTIIYDAAAISPTYSRIETWQGSTSLNTWGDELGGNNGFRSSGIGVNWGFTGSAISSVTFTLYTNYGLAGQVVGGQYVGFADLFIDVGADGSFSHAIDFKSEGKNDAGPNSGGANLAKLVILSGSIGYKTSQDLFGTASGLQYGGLTNICSGTNDAACQAGSRAPETKVTGNTAYDLTVSNGGNGTLVGPNGSPTYTYSYSVTLSGIDFTGWDKLRLFWGTGWCANDTVEGTAVVPVPAALPIMAAALAGFGFAGWRRNRTAA